MDPAIEYFKKTGFTAIPVIVKPEPILSTKKIGKEPELAKEYYEFDSETNEIAPVKKEKAAEKARGIFSRVDKWKLFKQLSSTVARGCASAVIVKCAENSMPENMTLMEKIVAKVGLYFISGLVSAKVTTMVEDDLDEWKDTLLKAVSESEMEKENADGGAEA